MPVSRVDSPSWSRAGASRAEGKRRQNDLLPGHQSQRGPDLPGRRPDHQRQPGDHRPEGLPARARGRRVLQHDLGPALAARQDPGLSRPALEADLPRGLPEHARCRLGLRQVPAPGRRGGPGGDRGFEAELRPARPAGRPGPRGQRTRALPGLPGGQLDHRGRAHALPLGRRHGLRQADPGSRARSPPPSSSPISPSTRRAPAPPTSAIRSTS